MDFAWIMKRGRNRRRPKVTADALGEGRIWGGSFRTTTRSAITPYRFSCRRLCRGRVGKVGFPCVEGVASITGKASCVRRNGFVLMWEEPQAYTETVCCLRGTGLKLTLEGCGAYAGQASCLLGKDLVRTRDLFPAYAGKGSGERWMSFILTRRDTHRMG